MGALEYGYVSLKHFGEELCGDTVEILPQEDGGATIVLADGMGSGVKASILSTLTSKMLCSLAAAGVPLEECLDAVTQSLPVCHERGVAYSTFTLCVADKCGNISLAEYDNPPAILLRKGGAVPIECAERQYGDKKLRLSRFAMTEGDCLLICSDGILGAGTGQALNYDWTIEEIRAWCAIQYDENFSARTMASLLANACYELYGGAPYDDTTVLAVRYRAPLTVHMMIGPPASPEDDAAAVREFLSAEGKHVVCGGTTGQVVAKQLGTTVRTSFEIPDKDVPPVGFIDGIDLVTEGLLTLRKVLTHIEKFAAVSDPSIKLLRGEDGATALARLLAAEASHVCLYVGKGVNYAHADLGIDNQSKLDAVVKLMQLLKTLGKTVDVKYY